MKLIQEVLLGTVQLDIAKYTTGRSPPGPTDCWLLAYGQVKSAIVVTDDLGMHTLASDFGLKVWLGFELLAKLRSAKIVDNDLVREIYDALDRNGDLTDTWREAKQEEFLRVFGSKNLKTPETECDSKYLIFIVIFLLSGFECDCRAITKKRTPKQLAPRCVSEGAVLGGSLLKVTGCSEN